MFELNDFLRVLRFLGAVIVLALSLGAFFALLLVFMHVHDDLVMVLAWLMMFAPCGAMAWSIHEMHRAWVR